MMRSVSQLVLAALFLAGAALPLRGTARSGAFTAAHPSTRSAPTFLRLDSLRDVEVINGTAEIVTYRGRRATHLVPLPGAGTKPGSMLALIKGLDFKNGTIEVEVVGVPRSEAPPDSRGFVGIGFRVQPEGAAQEMFYLRPTNARADDQLRRNHSTQYVSPPDFPWYRLRKENPGVYESYADMEAGAWTRMKIEVSGTKARLYVNGASQPCLVVNDLKLGETHGQVALWAATTTDAYFSNLRVRRSAAD
jgi:hypothetical protein